MVEIYNIHRRITSGVFASAAWWDRIGLLRPVDGTKNLWNTVHMGGMIDVAYTTLAGVWVSVIY